MDVWLEVLLNNETAESHIFFVNKVIKRDVNAKLSLHSLGCFCVCRVALSIEFPSCHLLHYFMSNYSHDIHQRLINFTDRIAQADQSPCRLSKPLATYQPSHSFTNYNASPPQDRQSPKEADRTTTRLVSSEPTSPNSRLMPS